MRGYKPGRFSFNVRGGRCEACQGDGIIQIEMHFLPDVYVPCEVCHGTRYSREVQEVKFRGHSISDVLELTVDEALEVFENVPRIKTKLQTLHDVGLGYIRLGQPATQLSGGEAQRVKLSAELSRRDTGRTLYLLDEPTTGLHYADVERLLVVLHRLVDHGNTVVVIEHNLDVLKTADWLIDLGPEGGEKGGYVIAEGTPEQLAANPTSATGQYLASRSLAEAGRKAARGAGPTAPCAAARATRQRSAEPAAAAGDRGYGALLRVAWLRRASTPACCSAASAGRCSPSRSSCSSSPATTRRSWPALTAFLAIFPGPASCRRSPVRCSTATAACGSSSLDYLIAAVSVGLIAGLSARHSLPPAAAAGRSSALSSLTNPLSSAGARSLFPILVAARAVGAGQRAGQQRSRRRDAGRGAAGRRAGRLARGRSGRSPRRRAVRRRGAGDAAAARPARRPSRTADRSSGMPGSASCTSLRNPTLRGLALTLSTFNLGWGILDDRRPGARAGPAPPGARDRRVPVGRPGRGGPRVGAGRGPDLDARAASGSSCSGAILVSRRARWRSCPSPRALAVVALVDGRRRASSNGPFDISLFTLRQRRTDPAWFGRAFAVSMSLNFVGTARSGRRWPAR